MGRAADIAAAVAPIVERWIITGSAEPLIIRHDAGGVAAYIGQPPSPESHRITGAQAAEILGITYHTFSRRGFFGLSKGTDRKFSRLATERLRDRRAK